MTISDPTLMNRQRSWAYRLAKRYAFNSFGTYDGMDHSQTSAPALVERAREPEVVELEV